MCKIATKRRLVDFVPIKYIKHLYDITSNDLCFMKRNVIWRIMQKMRNLYTLKFFMNLNI